MPEWVGGGGDLGTRGYVLRDGDLVLRPLTEADRELIRPWRQDPEVLGWRGGGVVEHRAAEEIRATRRAVAATPADVFVIEAGGAAVGGGWVQHMNVVRILATQPGRECRRVGLQLARAWRGRGIGTRAVRLLTRHAFATGADVVFALDVAADGAHSLRAFAANRYVPWRRVAGAAGGKTPYRLDLVCRRDYFEGRAPVAPHPGPDGVRAGDEPHGAMVVVHRRAPALEVLVLHRAGLGEAGDWAWTPPSGARFPAEPIDECAARELHEETGLEAEPARVPAAGTARWRVYALEVGMDAVIGGGDEHDRHEWVPAQEALRRCRPEVVRASLAAALATRSG